MTIPVRPTTAAVVRNPAGHGLRLVLQQGVKKASSSSVLSSYYYSGGVASAPAVLGGSSSCGFATPNRKSPLRVGSTRALAASARPRPVDDAVHDRGRRPSTVNNSWPSAAHPLRGGPVPPPTIPNIPRHSPNAATTTATTTAVGTILPAPPSPVVVVDRTSGPSREEVAAAASLVAPPHPQQRKTLTYVEGATMPITSRLHLVTPDEHAPRGIWPVFRLMDEDGTFRDPRADDDPNVLQPRGSPEATLPLPPPPGDLEGLRAHLGLQHPHLVDEIGCSGLLRESKMEYADVQSHNTLYRAYRQMIRLQTMDHILLNAQRQGRISFYMTCRGEEAIHMGAASALDGQDPILAQYREQGLLMWRGFTLDQFTNQCFSNNLDLGKGRQMPIHYGSRALNYHTVSSPLGTQLPQAVGVAYRLKLAGKPNVAACFFGDGCASTTDFHAALNFAATLQAPVLFVCRNNGYAISTPTSDQYCGDGIISRAKGYGMAGIRVDGNDAFAMHAAIRDAKAYALRHSAPVLIEAMTYRQGHHSTSDDSTRYRSAAEVGDVTTRFDPIARLAHFLRNVQWLTIDEETKIRDEEKVAVLRAMEQAERRPPPPLDSLFEDVYKDMPRHLQEQQAQLREHLARYPKDYNL